MTIKWIYKSAFIMVKMLIIYYNMYSYRGAKMLENKLGITNEIELAKEKEKITKLKVLELFDTNKIKC